MLFSVANETLKKITHIAISLINKLFVLLCVVAFFAPLREIVL
jgi:ABC-type transport system involved in cytochrome bd biosynthesis fused ATPase/permease subunit